MAKRALYGRITTVEAARFLRDVAERLDNDFGHIEAEFLIEWQDADRTMTPVELSKCGRIISYG